MEAPSSEPTYRLEVTAFTPSRHSEQHVVTDIESLRRLLAPHRDAERLAVYLDRDEGERGSLWVHLTGERAWVTHWEQIGGPDSYCRDAAYRGPHEMVGFLLPNGQEDEVHRAWTVSRAEGLRALEFFLVHGERDSSLTWEQEPGSLQEPFWPSDTWRQTTLPASRHGRGDAPRALPCVHPRLPGGLVGSRIRAQPAAERAFDHIHRERA